MKKAIFIEHINLTVADPDKTASMLCQLFDWHIRWSGDSMLNGYTVHVGDEDQYLALYRPGKTPATASDSYSMINGLNHIAIVVDDLADIEGRVMQAGYEPNNHGDYEPGKRFYFREENNIEFEIVSYNKTILSHAANAK